MFHGVDFQNPATSYTQFQYLGGWVCKGVKSER